MKPPKDELFLANIGYPWYVVSHWNEAMGYFVHADLQIDLFDGEWNDSYFTTGNFSEDDVIDWIEMPKIKDKNA